MGRRLDSEDGSMNWRDYLTPEETQELERIDEERREGQGLRRKIFDRCRRRMERKNKS